MEGFWVGQHTAQIRKSAPVSGLSMKKKPLMEPSFGIDWVKRFGLVLQSDFNQWDSGKSLSAVRLVYGESDGLPGFILDRYGDTLVLQVLSAGAERWREVFADLAIELTGAVRVFERSDAEVRQLENLPVRIATLRGDDPPERIAIVENGLQFWVDVRRGHKTGFYLDQRANRLRVRELAREREVLDCFCYTGGITANALAGGAKSVLGGGCICGGVSIKP